MNIILIIVVFSSFLTAYILTPIVRKIANSLGIVAHPGGRRVHAQPTPLMGGIAMYLGFMVAIGVAAIVNPKLIAGQHQTVLGIVIASTFVAVVGVLDDKFELPGWVQALSILVGGYLLTRFGIMVLHITNPFQGGHLLWLGSLSVPVTMLWVLMVTKAVDCMDGLDGLAAGIATIAAGTLMLMAMAAGPRFEMSAVMAGALMGGSIGFLRFNYPPAKIFMGTVGAQFLGFTLASISIAGAFKIATLVAVAAPILVLGVPLFDTTFVVLRRALSGKKIHEADTSHLHHRLVEKGLSHRQVIWVIYGICLVLCGIAYMLFRFVAK